MGRHSPGSGYVDYACSAKTRLTRLGRTGGKAANELVDVDGKAGGESARDSLVQG